MIKSGASRYNFSNNVDYKISNSVRFRRSASPALSRTSVAPTDAKRWTFSCWVKKSGQSVEQGLLYWGTTSPNYGELFFTSSNTIQFESKATVHFTTNALYRDANSWMHICLVVDTTSATTTITGTSTDRIRLYVNGVQVSSFSATSAPAQNSDVYVNSAADLACYFGRTIIGYLDGNIADIYFLDGLALDQYSFGRFNSDNEWVPRKYVGNYGYNGCFIGFGDGSSATALGYDTSLAKFSLNLGSTGTNIGGMSANGGLAAAFDGNLNQASAASACATGTTAGYQTMHSCGKDWGAGVTKTITGLRLIAPNDTGFMGSTATTFKLQGSTDNFSSSIVDLYVGSFFGTTKETVLVVGGIDTSTAYRYHRVILNGDGTNSGRFAELEFYESGVYGMNSYAVTNIINTAGVTCDTLIDTPTNNFPIINALAPTSQTSANWTYSYAGLKATHSSATQHDSAIICKLPTTGKWYFEAINDTTTTALIRGSILVATEGTSLSGVDIISTAGTWGISVDSNRYICTNGGNTSAAATVTSGTAWQFAIDCDAGKAWVGIGNSWYDTVSTTNGNPSAGTNQTWSVNFGDKLLCVGGVRTIGFDVNLGQRAFVFTPPAGFVALSTTNTATSLSTRNPADFFDAVLYSGSASALQVRRSGDNTKQMVPMLAITKCRTTSQGWRWFDGLRGTNYVDSSSTGAEASMAGVSLVNGGINLPANTTGVSTNGQTYVAYLFSGPTEQTVNTTGTITSTVMVNPLIGMSVVTYTGNGNASATVGHGLSAAPAMAIWFSRSSFTNANQHPVYLKGLTAGYDIHLQLTNQQQQVSTLGQGGPGTPSNSVLTFINGSSSVIHVNENNVPYVVYCFSEVPGFSKIGTYVGNHTSDGPYVHCGFRPKLIIFKAKDTTAGWYVVDGAREPNNMSTLGFALNDPSNEGVGIYSQPLDILSNGFKIRSSGPNDYPTNGSAVTYIYIAFAEFPAGDHACFPALAR